MYERPQQLTNLKQEPARTAPIKGGKDPLASTDYWDWCPRCSNRLESMKCKYICKRCGYYMSCADFD